MLTNEEGKYAIHNRAKGVSLDTIDKYTNDNLNGDKYEVYNKLFNEEKLTFDPEATDIYVLPKGANKDDLIQMLKVCREKYKELLKQKKQD